MIDPIRDLKHIVKIAIGRSDYYWYLDRFEQSINAETIRDRDRIVKEAEDCLKRKNEIETASAYENSSDPLVRQGWKLKNDAEKKFRDSHIGNKALRILLHLPDEKSSPAGFSIFKNLLEAFSFIGIETDVLPFGVDIKRKLHEFKPSVFLTGDNSIFLEKIDWQAVREYRSDNELFLGLSASLEEYGNTPLKGRLECAKKNEVSFYYTFRDGKYIESKPAYKPFFSEGYKILPLPFGANPLVHYPVPGLERDLDFAFIASTNKTKAQRYYRYFKKIFEQHYGFIDGPGWKHSSAFRFDRDRDRYIYARTKVGLNIHLEDQLKNANEVNERTYQLAACGVPQVTDHAKLLDSLFSKEAIFIADNPRQYKAHFEMALHDRKEAERRALIAQKETFDRYTTFHRASDFVNMLSTFK